LQPNDSLGRNVARHKKLFQRLQKMSEVEDDANQLAASLGQQPRLEDKQQ